MMLFGQVAFFFFPIVLKKFDFFDRKEEFLNRLRLLYHILHYNICYALVPSN